MFDYYKETYKVHGVDWTAKKAKLVLEAWQRKFTKVCSYIDVMLPFHSCSEITSLLMFHTCVKMQWCKIVFHTVISKYFSGFFS